MNVVHEPTPDFWLLQVLSITEDPSLLLHEESMHFRSKDKAAAFAAMWAPPVPGKDDEWRSEEGGLHLVLRPKMFADRMAAQAEEENSRD